MLQKKDYQQQQNNVTKQDTVTPTIKNVTKEGLPTTRYQQHQQKRMLQNKKYQQQQ